MPQVDKSSFLPILFSLVEYCSVFYAVGLVYVFFPFLSQIKLSYNFYTKIKIIKCIIVKMI